MNDANPRYEVRLAENVAEIMASQKLRYRVFVEEMGANSQTDVAAGGLEEDQWDAYCDHLILLDKTLATDAVVGVYRLLRSDRLPDHLPFYSASEYELEALTNSGKKLLELGRSCIAADHRGGAALLHLWSGLASYIQKNEIEVLFGVASFHGRNPEKFRQALSFLYHYHLMEGPDQIEPLAGRKIEMDMLGPSEVDRKSAVLQLPPLIKAYLRLGGRVGNGAYLDREFNTIDVCMVMDTANLSARHQQIYGKAMS